MITLNQKEEIKLELKLSCDTKVLKYIRKLVGEIAFDMGFSEEETSYIEMCVDEACTNVIKHAYPCNKSSLAVSTKLDLNKQDMKIFVGVLPNKIHISVIDYGIGVGRKSVGIQSINEYIQKNRQSGLGIFMIKKFMDKVNISSTKGSGTIIEMIKYKKE